MFTNISLSQYIIVNVWLELPIFELKMREHGDPQERVKVVRPLFHVIYMNTRTWDYRLMFQEFCYQKIENSEQKPLDSQRIKNMAVNQAHTRYLQRSFKLSFWLVSICFHYFFLLQEQKYLCSIFGPRSRCVWKLKVTITICTWAAIRQWLRKCMMITWVHGFIMFCPGNHR